MAGRILKKQYAVLGFTQGLVDMMWEQRYAHQPNNKTFAAARQRLIEHGDRMNSLFRKEGSLKQRDIDEIKGQIDALKIDHIPAGEFTPMLAVSFCIDLIVEQIALTRGTKKKAFEGLLTRIREFERYFDRNKTYDSPEGLEMAEAYRAMVA